VSLILNIDTAVVGSSICLAENDRALGLKVNPLEKDSAAWLHVAIRELLGENDLALQDLHAIAFSEGPGSYTGLRVGMATAKGLCYTLQKPLIAVNTLKMMAVAALEEPTELLCPMIDARRMEVFTSTFDKRLNTVCPTANLILSENSFLELLQIHTMCFFGNGSLKFQSMTKHPNAIFKTFDVSALFMISLSNTKFVQQDFADLPYSEPFYNKDFHSLTKQSL
jgi:tRNA threonylcarbamoyladenosine biosynthesis protein TsaB